MTKSKKKKFLGKVKLSTLFLLMITLASNAFAWFIYSTRVSSSFSAKVREWKVTFNADGVDIDRVVEINVEALYPGMEDFSKTLTIANGGEAQGNISYEVVSAEILGDDIMTLNMTKEETLNYLKTNYPFSIDMVASSETLAPKGEENVVITVTWPYESGDDETDTFWGTKAYDYHQENPDSPSIKLNIRIIVSQA